MTRIQKVSGYLLILFNILLVALPLMAILPWLMIKSSFVQTLMKNEIFLQAIPTPEGMINLSDVKWTPLTTLMGFSAYALNALPVFAGLYLLRMIFRNYKQGIIFNTANAQNYRNLAILFFFDALLVQPINQMLLVLAATLYNEPGHRYISAAFGTTNCAVLFAGALLITISWIMLEASKLQDEQQLTV